MADLKVEETQLALSRPQISQQLRVQGASGTPARAPDPSDDFNSFLGSTVFFPSAIVNEDAKVDLLPHSLSQVEQLAGVKNSMKDFSTMAFSSHRAGKKDMEALAYSSLGIIHDNLGDFHLAINSYQQYLQISVEMGDIAGQLKALNFLGVDHCLLARSSLEEGIESGSEYVSRHLHASASYHSRHLELADDGGKFVAHNNLGICYDLLDNIIESAKHHQNALRIAIQLQSLHGQSVAVGNLGLLAMRKKDLQTARTCFEQHLQLTQSLQDASAEINAWKMVSFKKYNELSVLKLIILAGEAAN